MTDPAISDRLRDSTAVIIGVGGLGSPTAIALAAAGVGHLVLVDDDSVELSNLHRQVLYHDDQVGLDKLIAARAALIERGMRPEQITLQRERLSPENGVATVRRGQVVLEGTDSYHAKFWAADACATAGVPIVHGGAIRWRATVFPVAALGAPCYRCLFEAPPADEVTCAMAGVMGSMVGLAGALMADEAIRILLDMAPFGRIYTYDGQRDQLRAVAVAPRANCPLCGARTRMSARRRDARKGPEPMEVTVRIPTQLRTLTGGEEAVTASGSTVKAVIEQLELLHPGMRDRLLSDRGVQRFVNIYVGEDDIRFLDGLDTSLRGGEEISIVPAIAGG